VRERELVGTRQLVWSEPAELDEIVAGTRIAAHARGPRETENDATVVGLEPEAEKGGRFELELGLFAHLASKRVERMLVLVEEAAGKIPKTGGRIDGAPSEQHAPPPVEADRLRSGDGVRVRDEAAARANDAIVGALDSLGAHGTEPPAVESAHAEDNMSPRAAGATQHELARIGLLASVPGETLARLAQRMTREEVPAGAPVVREGEAGDRFYVVLSGMLTVSQRTRGPQSVLRPGDYFGEVALAMDMPRTASVRALTPATLASCDRATFDEYVRPLFADDEGG
jgi:hypothetical protein